MQIVQSRAGRATRAPVAQIHRVRHVAQIRRRVICAAPVNVVDLMRRPATMNKRKNNAVSRYSEIRRAKAHADAAVSIHRISSKIGAPPFKLVPEDNVGALCTEILAWARQPIQIARTEVEADLSAHLCKQFVGAWLDLPDRCRPHGSRRLSRSGDINQGAPFGVPRPVLVWDAVPGDVGAEFFATHSATGSPLYGRAPFGWHLLHSVRPLPNKLWLSLHLTRQLGLSASF